MAQLEIVRARNESAWIFLRCVVFYVPAFLLVVGTVLPLLTIVLFATLLVGLLFAPWSLLKRRRKALRAQAEKHHADELCSTVLAAAARVAGGSETLPSALTGLSACRTDSAWPLAAKRIVQEATRELEAKQFAPAFILARFTIALSDSLLGPEDRLACRRILIDARLPAASALAKARDVVIRETSDRDRQAAPELWARSGWWQAGRIVADKPKDAKAREASIKIHLLAHSVLAKSGGTELRAEALRRLAGEWWKNRTGSREQALREEKAIRCAKQALALLPDKDDFKRAEIVRELGTYWYYRQKGERGQNLEEAIVCFAAAAEAQRSFGNEFALTQHWLGAAFLNRVQGDRARNLERAISCFQRTRHVLVSEAVKRRTQELLDRAVHELWGPAAAVVLPPASSSEEGGAAVADGAAAAATGLTDLSSLLPAGSEVEAELIERRLWWRLGKGFQVLTSLATPVLFVLFFRKPWLWMGSVFVSMATGMLMLSANTPRVQEQYFYFVFLGLPRLGLELFRAYRVLRGRLGSVVRFILSAFVFSAQPESMLPMLRQAEQDLDAKRFPLLRLGILQSYGNILQESPVGEVGESLEEAILHLQTYRGLWKRKGFAFLALVNNRILAEAYLKRRRGDEAKNARRALDILEADVLPYGEFSAGGWKRKRWAEQKRAHFLLGEAWRRLAAAEEDAGARDREVEQATASYTKALACKMPPERAALARLRQQAGRSAPVKWEPLLMDAESCAGLADLWHQAGDGEDNRAAASRRLSLLEAAERLVSEAAAIATKQSGFVHAGMARTRIQIILLRARLEGELSDDPRRERCAAMYRQAAGEAMREGFSALVLEALAGLGKLLYAAQQDAATIDALNAVIDYQDRIRWQVMSIQRRAELLRENIEDFDLLIASLLRMGRIEEAVSLSERSRSRTLSDLVHLRGVLPREASDLSEQDRRKNLLRLARLDAQSGSDDERYELLRHLSEDTAAREPERDLAAAVQPLSAEAMKALAASTRAILLLLRVTAERSFAFLVFPDGTLEVVETAHFTSADLERVADVMERKGERRQGEIALESEWRTALEGVLAEISERLLGPVRERLQKSRAPEGAEGSLPRLIIVPNRSLAVLPLHACFWEVGGKRQYLIDDFVVSYTPNLSVLERCRERDANRTEEPSLFAIGNPLPAKDPLPYTEWECEQVERAVGATRSLVSVGTAATLEEVRQRAPEYSCLHFACHASYLTNDPFNSHLLLADASLTLGEIFEQMTLPKAWLVALSACETGRLDTREVADESLGLATGFLIAGASTVWCTLWKTHDVPTTLLMSKAYEILFSTGKERYEALREAQLWLRDATGAELRPLLAALISRWGTPEALETVSAMRKDDRPYEHPADWAAYESVGA